MGIIATILIKSIKPGLQSLMSGGTTFTYMTTGDFITDYNPYVGTATIQHQ